MFSGIMRVALNVCDMQKSLAFYCEDLGLERVPAGLNEGDESGGACLRVAKDCYIDLIPGGIRVDGPAYDFARIGYHHYCLSVGDIGTLALRLWRRGIIPKPLPTFNKDSNLGLWIEDPDGNAIEIIQYLPESPLMAANRGAWDYDQKGFINLAHISYVVRDMEQSLQYYRDRLGFTLELYLEDDDKPFLNLLRISDGAYVELFYTGKRLDERPENASGCRYCGFRCEDLAASAEALRRQGTPIDRESVKGSGQSPNVWIADPDGNRFELIQAAT